MKAARSLVVIALAAALGACTPVLAPRSEVPLTDAQIAGMPTGIDRSRLLQTLGPPAEEAAYKNLNETVLSWRLVEPGNQHWLFNAHMDPSGRVVRYSRTLDPAANLGGRGTRF